MSERENGRRLPPPAFPPGSRRRAPRGRPVAAEEPTGAVENAILSPDDPLPDRIDPMGSAFILPDEPIPERKIELVEEFRGEGEVEPGEEGVVVGMDLQAHLDATEVASGGDPHVVELSAAVGKLAEGLRTLGEAGLRARPEMSRFETTLREYCVGYLAGRRAEDPPQPILEEPRPTDG